MRRVKFFCCQNNGVIAYVPAVVFDEYLKYHQDSSNKERSPLVFTVISEERRRKYPTACTCTQEEWEAVIRLIKAIGNYEIMYAQRDFYVPFSNGVEFGTHGHELEKKEMLYYHSLTELLDFLGVKA